MHTTTVAINWTTCNGNILLLTFFFCPNVLDFKSAIKLSWCSPVSSTFPSMWATLWPRGVVTYGSKGFSWEPNSEIPLLPKIFLVLFWHGVCINVHCSVFTILRKIMQQYRRFRMFATSQFWMGFFRISHCPTTWPNDCSPTYKQPPLACVKSLLVHVSWCLQRFHKKRPWDINPIYQKVRPISLCPVYFFM